ncbi:MAG: prolipoprotein diacylglyceryl transferase [Bacteroidetes bacterium]|jgi:phosphatidylglycerol:prolipoprotein diacylglycerol transferase|nr:MAG: prolipoprotein diacylglyceryl transferase [Bacteroidota bacterium]
MYPNLYYAFKDLFGLEWSTLRFVNSFGFFVAISFILAAIFLTMELRRKSKQGLLFPTEMQVMVGKPASPGELLLNFILGFLLGYKIVGLFIMDNHTTADPQEFIFSPIGSWPAGIGIGLLFAGLKWYDKNKQKLAKPEKRNVRIWPQDRVGEMTILALVFGLLGAKLFDIFENWSDFLKRPEDYIFSAEGLTFYGGLICAALAIWAYAKRHKIGFWHLNDAAAPALMLAYAVGRIGCQVAGDGDWGIVNTKPKPFSWLPDWMWAYTYPHNVARQGDPIPGCTDRFCFELSQPVYPTPFYETIMCLVLFAILWSVRKKIKVPGRLFALYLMLNGLERFFIEKIRVNTRINFSSGFQPTQAEVISTLLFLAGLFLWIFLYQKSKAKTEGQTQLS